MRNILILILLLFCTKVNAIEVRQGMGLSTGITGNSTEIFGIKLPNYVAVPLSLTYFITLDNFLLETGFGTQMGIKSIGSDFEIKFGKLWVTWEFSFGYLWKRNLKTVDTFYHGVSADVYLSFLDNANDIGFGASYILGKNRWTLTFSTGINVNLITDKWGGYGRFGLGLFLW